MNDLHYAEDTLIDYFVAPEEISDREAMEKHLKVCSSCREVTESYAQFSESLSDPLVWELEDLSSMVSRFDEKRVEDFVAYARQFEDERMVAPECVDSILALEPLARRHLVETSPEMWTAGVAFELCERAHRLLDSQPAKAREFSELAIEVADKLSSSAYQSGTVLQLRGRAWKEHAQALKFLGQHTEALQALDKAEAIYSQAIVSEFDLATVAFVRAAMLRELNQLTEALKLAQQSAQVFAQFGHRRRYLHAQYLEGQILYNSGEIRRARDIWMGLLRPFQAEDDLKMLGSTFKNIANCYIELGDVDSASTYLMQAISLFKDLGLASSALYAQWTLARMLVAKGEYSEGLTRLRAVHHEYENIQMMSEAGVVGLDIVDALLSTGKPEEAAVICRYLVEHFTACGMDSNAITAVAYLREALAAGKATPVLARQVRSYVAELPQHAELLFLSPPL